MSEKENMIEIGGETFNLYKTGVEQARQVTRLLKWLGKYATPLINEFSDDAGNIKFDSVFEVLIKIADVVDDETLISAYEIVIGCNREFANENFDINVLADSIEVLMKNETYRKVIERFFGTQSSNTNSEQSSIESE